MTRRQRQLLLKSKRSDFPQLFSGSTTSGTRGPTCDEGSEVRANRGAEVVPTVPLTRARPPGLLPPSLTTQAELPTATRPSITPTNNCWPRFWFPALTKQLSSGVNLSSPAWFEKVWTKCYHTSRPTLSHENCWAPSNEVCAWCERHSKALMTALFHYMQIQPWRGDQRLRNKTHNAVLCNMHIPSEYRQCCNCSNEKKRNRAVNMLETYSFIILFINLWQLV